MTTSCVLFDAVPRVRSFLFVALAVPIAWPTWQSLREGLSMTFPKLEMRLALKPQPLGSHGNLEQCFTFH